MHIKLIEGESTIEIRLSCYAYLEEKYRKERLDGRSICEGEYGGASKEGVQLERPDSRMPKKSKNG
ncbi:hypothetical protein [Brevibacillus laterosporus]|uniref:hypothetical protein n=1 Tax=Brevibacillus laterosporus TaxID=1465 RepID=UPI001EF76536|nr:hypothetical protein [Brevibacillus laterosporus]WNX32501.1 hypothetical protein RWW94_06750 [Brevibacillus laterosporus]